MDEAAYRLHPFCRGDQNDGCGARLVDGGVLDRRWRWVAFATASALAITLGMGVVMRLVFPAPLTGVNFATRTTEVVEGQPYVILSVRREDPGKKALSVHYRTHDGNAHASQDYVAREGVMRFAAGEVTKSIEIPLLPGRSDDDARKSFSLHLDNVEGEPSHVVVIAPAVTDHETLEKAEVLVRSVSGISMDIASLYVKRKMLQRIINSSTLDPTMRRTYGDSLRTLDVNLDQAQKRYAEMLGNLASIDRRTVSRSFDVWDAKLDKMDLQQQRATTRIARRQYIESLGTGDLALERWAQQLSEAIPKPRENTPGIKPL